MTALVSVLLKSRASPDMLPFSLCNKRRLAIQHMNRPLFPTTLSIPSYGIGKQVGLRTYQRPVVVQLPQYEIPNKCSQQFRQACYLYSFFYHVPKHYSCLERPSKFKLAIQLNYDGQEHDKRDTSFRRVNRKLPTICEILNSNTSPRKLAIGSCLCTLSS